MSNRLARSSIEALACLAGLRESTPDNDGVQNSLRAMLTQFSCRLMAMGENDRVLKILNSNIEDPYIIWDNSTRAELLEFVEKHRNSSENMVFFVPAFLYIYLSKNSKFSRIEYLIFSIQNFLFRYFIIT